MRFTVRRYVCAAILMSLLITGLGCAKAPTDPQMTEQIHSKLNQDSGLQGKSIAVETSGGVATLSGTVDNDTQRAAAAHYASTTPGIKEVVNNLQVATQAASANPPMAPAPTKLAAAPPSAGLSSATPSSATPLLSKPRTSAPPQRAQPGSANDNSSGPLPNSTAASQTDNPEPPAAKEIADATPAVPEAPMPPPAPKMLTIQSGTPISVRLVDSIDSETAKIGQTFRATLDTPLSSDWDIAIPAGYAVEGHVADVKSAGKLTGQPELVLQLDRVQVGDKSYNLQTDQYRRQGKNRSTNTAQKVGAGAVLGAIIGGIAAGGKGAGIGAAAGGGAGGAVQAASKPQPVKLASETVLSFTLQSPLTVEQVEQSPDTQRQKLQPGPQ
ncbi:MAG: BON domain-containing protein [Terriglobales bacterium]|jgi:hypothetical protein